jgi:folate-dependent phosphoribosylglycinamide formyltransferase PurN
VETLHGRIRIEEHRLYPEIVKAFVEGRLELGERGGVMR